MKLRRTLSVGSIVILAAVVLGLPSAANAAVTQTGTDPTGDASPATNDITGVSVSLDHSDVSFTITTASALPALTDPSWDNRIVGIELEGGLDPDTGLTNFLTSATKSNRASDVSDSRGDDGYPGENFPSLGLFQQGVFADSGSDHGDPAACNSAGYNITGTSLILHASAACLGYPGNMRATAIISTFTKDANGNAVYNRGATDVAFGPNVEKVTSTLDATVGGGYYALGSDGGVFSFGDAKFYGSTGNIKLNRPVVGMSSVSTNNGYRFVASDGGIFAYGSAQFYGSMGGKPLNKPIVGMTTTADGNGYYLVASDGGIFAYGNAQFYGSMGGKPLNKPIVGMAETPSGHGYWMVASDGGIFAFGDANFFGSLGGRSLNRAIVSMASTPSGQGYEFVASDGGVFAFGDAIFAGSGVANFDNDVVGIEQQGTGGYDLVGANGDIFNYGTAYDFGDPYRYNVHLNGPLVGMAALH